MKKFLGFILALFVSVQGISALSDIEKILIKEATNPELKKIAKDYLIKKAKDHRSLSEKYKSLAARSQGGKANASNEEHAKYKKLADHCDAEAKEYEEEASKL
ncbi:LIC_10421 family protein [Leptospira kmetyi]|uniref:DUF1104 domain-containing protein n=1 Tax=Leptospira kmetyi TaxID=408139 RepID=A0A2M9XU54_9LEPT|nr:hypothetical protein [Leptospira kmetyi]AYV57348.1 hypothetical protein EFP84_02520 [Leptospira kmetyi]EQA53058.1 hypothetical protein LEP1GSC052_1079 [Leptospira kmetyi serovar Malaysia str. Bejo-Iso9]PJZ30640.1 hypothetical protein CH378_06665 [Leptospira kmetyi]PJZ42827.1 hypothetical protein CH370_04105 [Leptospira kmetyi]TGK12687.1 hypothetical protein EHO62_19310 [Leptospira kmetyi]